MYIELLETTVIPLICRTAEKICLRTPPTGLDWEQSSVSTTLPYNYTELSEPICRVLQKLDVKVRFQPFRTLYQMLVKPKDLILESAQNGVVYRIPCKDCSKAYIDQSKRSR